jgi:putative ABC transport system permease protein
MGKLLLVYRLGLKDLRHRRVTALLLLLAIAAGAATLTLGFALHGTTDSPYARTRAATHGPDVVATVFANALDDAGPATTATPGSGGPPIGGDQATAALDTLLNAPGVTAHGGPYPITWTTLTSGRTAGSAEIEARDTVASPVDTPKLLHGAWIRSGGVVIEAGYASHLGVHVGDRVTLGGVRLDVVGIAVTAAVPAYPNTCSAEGCFLANGLAAHNPGLIWASATDANRITGTDGPEAYYLNLRLADPSTAAAFAARYATDPATTLLTWQQLRDGDAQTLARVRQILLAGSWLLGLLALASVTVLVGGRMAEQTRRVGLVKAVGGTPWLVAAVLLGEHIAIALIAAAVGILTGRLAAPLLDSPGTGLLGAAGTPALTGTTIIAVVAFALTVAIAATLVPAVRAAHQSTIDALNDAARAPRRRELAVRLTAYLPAPLLLGVRIALRRPRRLVLVALSITVTTSGLVTVMTYRATAGTWLADPGVTQATTVVSAMLIVLAAVNTVFIAWTTALDARHAAALARALGATPNQITAGLTTAQLIPALAGAMLGIPGGLALYNIPKEGGPTVLPNAVWLIATVAAVLLATGVLSMIPARIGVRRPTAHALQTENA